MNTIFENAAIDRIGKIGDTCQLFDVDTSQNQLNTMFEQRENVGYWAQVGNAGRLFEISQYGQNWQTTHDAAQNWYAKELTFQDPGQSLTICAASWTRLTFLVHRVCLEFPIANHDYHFIIDEYRGVLAVVFGSLLVTESNDGYNIEMIVNQLKKDTVVICTNVTIETAAEILRNSKTSKKYCDIQPRALHLSEMNVETLSTLCGLK